MKKKCLFLVILLCLTSSLFSAEKNTSDKQELPQAIQDLRRFEIITLGSMPFVTMDISLAYTGYKNIIKKDANIQISPFGAFKYDPETDGKFFESDCGKMILWTVAASVLVGTIDFSINLGRRTSINSKNKKNAEKNIIISDLENDSSATKLSVPKKNGKEKE